MKISDIVKKLQEAQKAHGDATLKQHGFVVDRVEINPLNKDEAELGVVVKVD
ncbi:hypothetical protein M2267_003018 [Ensifer sp. KUDG1]|uniref:hypothetical protein n=1 Tax=Ensifer sp. KUDG1 TaxID=3373919 RepID=UPI003D251EE2